ncbi:MAG: SusC/RagA family TonB-linked outer membrane protein [Flavobacteriales bacterium]|tara:strand:+ start:17149 stop:20061 length:2913 start_codon:yes stop_codon:yes gene_type:complete
MKINLNSFLLILLLCPIFIFGQTSINGIVTDEISSSPIAGVNVLVKDSNTGTATDFEGNYSINLKKGDILSFSYVGYKTQQVTLGDQTSLNIVLIEDTSSLDEIVVIGYGSVKKEDLTGAADLVTSEDFNQGPILSPQQLIAGKIAGVSVTSSSGSPGDGQSIRIRGLGSLSLTNSPLIVLDGLPLNDGGVGGSRNPLNMVSPNDIESMVVLKDASATAIYGSRGANGVILITTKKGRDSGFKYNYSSSLTTYSAENHVDVLTASEFTELITSGGNIDAIAALGSSNTNWQDQIYNRATGTENSLSVVGNAYGIPMRASVSLGDHEGILMGDNFKRTNASLSLRPNLLNDKLKIELNTRLMNTENRFANRGAIGSALSFDPTKPVFNGSQYGGYFSWIDSATGNQAAIGAPTNPLALLNMIDDISEVDRIVSNLKLDYDLNFINGLTATINVGIDQSKSVGSTATSELIPTSDPTWNGSLSRYEQEATNNLFDAYLTYNTSFKENHNLSFVLGHSYQSFEFDNYSFDSEAQEDGNDFEFIDKSKNVLLSYFGRLNYDFDGKYLLTATLRADASSKLNPNDRWGYFPSLAAAWNIHKEDFFKGNIFNSLKLRVGYGEVGNVNGLGDYKFLTRYTGSTSTAYYQFGNSFYQTYRPEPINPDLRWEIGETLNIGIDYSMFNNKLNGSINVYNKTTKDLIAYTLVDPFTNFGNRIDANIGDMQNRGIELSFNIPIIKTDEFEYTLDANIAFNDNVVTRLPDQQFIGGISGGVGNNIQTHIEGESPYSFLVYQQVYNNNGIPIEGVYVDRNGDDIINDDDRYIKEDPFADIIMGFTETMKWKSWDLSATARASVGNYAYNNVASNSVLNATWNTFQILNNIHSDYLSTGFQNFTENSLLSDHYIQEASFFKIDNITLGYTIPDFLGECNLRIYGSLQNVATFTDYDGIDPEIYGGIDNNFYPRPRTGVFGINIDF